MADPSMSSLPPTQPWSAEVVPTTPGWTRVPGPSSAAPVHDEEWIAQTAAQFEQEWGADWHPSFGPVVTEMLERARDTREPDVLLDLLYWPFYRPLASRVTVRAGSSEDPGAWGRLGFHVTAYDGAELGPGLQCVASRSFREGDFEATLIHAHYVFDDGHASVVVSVEPTLEELFTHMSPGLHGLLGTLTVRGSDGSAFVAAPVPGLSDGDEDRWESVDRG